MIAEMRLALDIEDLEESELDAQLDRLFDPRPISADEAVQLHFDRSGRVRDPKKNAEAQARWRSNHPDKKREQQESFSQKRRLGALAQLMAEWRAASSESAS